MSGSADAYKRAAAAAALERVIPGMRLGLGTGSTAYHFVDLLGERVRGGLDVVGVPTSELTRRQAEAVGIRLTTLDETPSLDLCVDGADEIDPDLVLIKGGGGALTREKIVAQASARMIVIADASKRVDTLGGFPLPVEVVPFGALATVNSIQEATRRHGLGGAVVQRMTDNAPVITDNGNLIFDCHFRTIPEPARLAVDLSVVAGVVEHGLFVDHADVAFIGGPDGVQVIEPEQRLEA